MNNNLIKTDTLWYKMKRVFAKVFHWKQKENANPVENQTNKKPDKDNFLKDLTDQTTLANKLLSYEVSPNELTEQEIDEMTEYFTNDIHGINTELERIKLHIIAMQQELKK